MQIEAITPQTLAPYLSHLARQVGESGNLGLPIFNPLPRATRPTAEDLRPERERGLATPLDEPLWRRMWGAWDGDEVVGGSELLGGAYPSELHRATFSLGLERRVYGRGVAMQLVEAVLAWVREQPRIEYLQLDVFATNTSAIRLYERLGFERAGVIADRFRVDGEVIDDLIMTYRVAR
ncbi:MAG: GNAT family N-acetyltransferase [Acidobacteriota bacterium]